MGCLDHLFPYLFLFTCFLRLGEINVLLLLCFYLFLLISPIISAFLMLLLCCWEHIYIPIFFIVNCIFYNSKVTLFIFLGQSLHCQIKESHSMVLWLFSNPLIFHFLYIFWNTNASWWQYGMVLLCGSVLFILLVDQLSQTGWTYMFGVSCVKSFCYIFWLYVFFLTRSPVSCFLNDSFDIRKVLFSY